MNNEEKSMGQKLQEQLCYKTQNIYENISEEEIAKAFDFCEGYKTFLDQGKTEREVVDVTLDKAIKAGYTEFKFGTKYKTGDKFYFNNRNKCIILVKVGEKDVEEGLKIVMAHNDSPRLDLKPRPLYEDAELAFFRTNYYGGIKKYQWPSIPLALHGVLFTAKGDCVKVTIGEDESDPVFCVPDLLPHLGKDQMTQPLAKAIEGENLTVLIGSRPFKDDNASEKVKLNILNILFEKYGITEKDFVSAELEVVPTFKAKDVGLDRSMIGAYGQDDRVCAYPCLMSILAMENQTPEYTSVCLLCDKEETGSDGNTGLSSMFFKYFIEQFCKGQGADSNICMTKSLCLSADVTAAFDPVYPTVHDRANAAFLNRGVSIMKYSGSGGKYSTSDASAETMSYFRRLFDDNGVFWQIGCLGKVDGGGGGTLAKYIANLNIDVLDIGVPVISMHSPFEITSKLDVYMSFKAYEAFLLK